MSTPISWHPGVTRVVATDGHVVGLGVLVSRTEVVTCAHVVSQALGVAMSASPPPGELRLVFPFLAGSPGCRARLLADGWTPLDGDLSGDVAVLELLDPAPADARPVRLARPGNVRDHEYELVGYRPADPAPVEVLSRGVLVGGSGDRLQLGPASASGSRFKLEPGCSGTPVFDATSGHVIGLFQLTDAAAGSDLSFALGTERVFRAWPELMARYLRGCPYRALEPHTPDDPYFFGRDRLVEEVVAAVRGSRGWCLLQGPSGAGKTSLVQARLSSAIERSAGVVALRLRPSDRSRPARSLLAAARRRSSASDPRAVAWEPPTAQAIEAEPGDALRDLLEALGGRQLVLVLDQAEELMQLDPGARASFVGTLLSWSRLLGPDGDPLVRIVVVVANSWSASVLGISDIAAAVERVCYVNPLTTNELREAVERPLQVDGFARLAPGLAQRIVDDLGTHPHSLPVLQLLMTRLWERDARSGVLGFAGYEEVRADRVLEEYLDSVWPRVGATQRAEVDRLFLHLIALNPETTGDRVHYTTRVAAKGELDDATWAAIEPLRAHRILATSVAEGRDAVEFTHDLVAQVWPPVRGVVGANVELLRWRQAMRPRIGTAEQGRGRLLGYWELRAARQRLAGREYLLSTREKEFLRGSRRRLWARSAVAGLLATVLTIGTLVGVQHATEQEQRRTAVQALLAQAQGMRDSDPRTALRLGLTAHTLSPDDQTTAELAHTLTRTRYAGTLTGHRGAVLAVAYAANGLQLATVGDDGRLLLFDTSEVDRPQLKGEATVEGADRVLDVDFSPDGHILATADSRSQLLMWDISDIRHPKRVGPPLGGYQDWPVHLAFSADGDTLASGGSGGLVLWDIRDPNAPVRGPPVHADTVISVAMSPDGTTIATGGTDGTVTVWRRAGPATAIQQGARPQAHHGVVTSVAFAGLGRELISGGADGRALRWDMSDPHALRELGALPPAPPGRGEPPTAIDSLTVSRDGHFAAAGYLGTGNVALWDLPESGNPDVPRLLRAHKGTVDGVAFAPDGRTLASAGTDATTVLWITSDRAAPTRSPPPFIGNTGTAVATAVAAHSLALAKVAPSGQVSLEDPEHVPVSGVLRRPDPTFDWQQDGYAVTFSPDGTTLAAGVGRTVALWDLPRLSRVRPDDGTGTTIAATDAQALAFSPDSSTLAVGEPKFVQLWRLRPGARPVPAGSMEHNASGLWALAFAPPDGHLLAAAGTTKTIWLWDLRTPGSPPLTLIGPAATVTALTFSPDGRMLAAGDANGQLWLWQLAAGSPPAQLGQPQATHAGTVFDLTFAPDSRTIATAGARSVILWDLADPAAPQPLGVPLSGYNGWVLSVAFQRSGDTLVTSTRDAQLVVWDVSKLHALRDNAVRRACDLAGDGLSPQEWKAHLPLLDYQNSCT